MKKLLFSLLIVLSGCQTLQPVTLDFPQQTEASRNLGSEILVKLKDQVSPQDYAKKNNLVFLKSIGLNIYLFSGKADLSLLKKNNQVRWAEQNQKISLPPLNGREVSLTQKQNYDPLLPAQYYVPLTGADKIWKEQKGRNEVIVAVIDSGIDASHPEFAGQLVPGWDTTITPSVPGGNKDGYGHGTHVAGVIAAKHNDQGIAGIAPDCRLMPVRIFNDFGHSTSGAAAEAVIWAVDHGAKVINASWGSPMPGQASEDAYQYALQKDVVFVSAVGNSGSNETKYYPGASEGVIGVSATTDIDTWASFSTWGDWVDLAAPGKGILSTFPLAKGNGYRIMEGTSMAAPIVSAAAALVRSEFPQLTQKQIKERLEKTAKDVIMNGVDPYAGSGRVDIFRAVKDPL